MFKHVRRGKEYRQELFKMPQFWVGASLLIFGVILSIIKMPYLIDVLLIIVGFILAVSCKYRIIGRLDERLDERYKHSKP